MNVDDPIDFGDLGAGFAADLIDDVERLVTERTLAFVELLPPEQRNDRPTAMRLVWAVLREFAGRAERTAQRLEDDFTFRAEVARHAAAVPHQDHSAIETEED